MASLKKITINAVFLAAMLPLSALAIESSGCGDEPGLKSGTYNMTFGKERVYRVHVPRGFNNSQPAPWWPYSTAGAAMKTNSSVTERCDQRPISGFISW